jgi:hypothetical protein
VAVSITSENLPAKSLMQEMDENQLNYHTKEIRYLLKLQEPYACKEGDLLCNTFYTEGGGEGKGEQEYKIYRR